jgi:hypothetical protein
LQQKTIENKYKEILGDSQCKKRLILKKPSLNADFNLYREYDHFLAEAYPEKNPEIYNIAFADGNDIRKFNVFDFVDKCVDHWLGFLESHGLVHIVNTKQ